MAAKSKKVKTTEKSEVLQSPGMSLEDRLRIVRMNAPRPQNPPKYNTPLALEDHYLRSGEKSGIFSNGFGAIMVVCYLIYLAVWGLQTIDAHKSNTKNLDWFEGEYAHYVQYKNQFDQDKVAYDSAWQKFLLIAREHQLVDCASEARENIPRCEFVRRISSDDQSLANAMYLELLLEKHGEMIYGMMPPHAPDYATLRSIVMGEQGYPPFDSFTELPVQPEVPLHVEPWDNPDNEMWFMASMFFFVPFGILLIVVRGSEFEERTTFNHKSFTWYSWVLIAVITPWLLPFWIRSVVTETYRLIKHRFTLRAHERNEALKIREHEAEIERVRSEFFQSFDSDLRALYTQLTTDVATYQKSLEQLPTGEHVAMERVRLEQAVAQLQVEMDNIQNLQTQRNVIADKAKFTGVQDAVKARLQDTRGQRTHFQNNIDAAEEIIELEEASKA